MSSVPRSNLLGSVTARLTLLSSVVIVCSTVVAYILMYGYLANALQSNIDHFLGTEMNEFRSIFREGGLEALRSEVRVEEFAQGQSRIFIRVLDSQGKDLIGSDLSHWGNAADWTGPVPTPSSDRFATTYAEPGGLEARRVEGYVGTGVFVIMGVANEPKSVVLNTFRDRFFEMFAVLAVVSLTGAWLIANRAMRGVEMVTVAAEEIAGGALERRITGKGYGTEIDRLASVFNRMLEKIAALITEARTLNDNIAHELRSPLTRIRGAAEAAATSHASTPQCQELAATFVEETDGLLAIVNSMLAISQMEAGLVKIESRPVDCARLVRDACDLFLPAAEDREIGLRANIEDEVILGGDNGRLTQAVANLIDNALKYTPSGGSVTVTLRRVNNQAVIAVADTGIGIAPNEIPHIFDRFYRSDAIRGMPGNGLGLGLVRAIVTSHAGNVGVRSEVGKGSEFTINLPIRPAVFPTG